MDPRYESYRVFDDGAKGVTWTHFNKIGGLKWKNEGGDWIDAAGTKQGDYPLTFTHVAVKSDPQFIMLDALPLMWYWEKKGNVGCMLRGMGEKANYSSREDVILDRRPKLIVSTENGIYECPCIGDVHLGDTSQGLGTRNPLGVGRALIRFDLSAVQGPAVSATIQLYSAKQYGDHILGAFLIDIPVPFDVDGIVEYGFAWGYDVDKGIENDERVIHTWDWPVGWKQSSGVSRTQGNRDHTSLKMDGSKDDRWWLKVEMPVDATCTDQGEGTGLTVHYELGDVPESIIPIPKVPTYPDHVFFRYSVKLDANWTSVNDYQMTGGKFPGFNGRFGYPRNGDYWQHTCGNGGNPGQGIYKPASPRGSRYNSFCGWSARSQWMGGAYNQHGNPMKDCTHIGGYLYHPQWARSGTGENRMWSNAFLATEREYDVEIEIKTNDVIGPYDQYGNGVAVANGIYRAWIDGVRVENDEEFIWRKHPYITIQSVWIIFKNGGTLSPCLPHSVNVGPVVVAKEYIGPRNFTIIEPPKTKLQEAMDALSIGQCVEFDAPSLNVNDSSGSLPFHAPPLSGGVPILDWASVMDYDASTKRFYFSGGRPYDQAPPQKMIWYDELNDVWDSRGNWSGLGGGHIYRSNAVASSVRKVLVMLYGSAFRAWDIDLQQYDGELPRPDRRLGGKSSSYSPVSALMWHPNMGAMGSAVMINRSWNRVNAFDWETQEWSNIAMLGADLWVNQHVTGHYHPLTDAVIGGYSNVDRPTALVIVNADKSYRLTKHAPCNVSIGGDYGGMFIPHPTRRVSIAVCKSTHHVWYYEWDTDEWIDHGLMPAQFENPKEIGGTVHGGVFVARYGSGGTSKTFIWKPE